MQRIHTLKSLPLNGEGLPALGITIVYTETKTVVDAHNRCYLLPDKAVGWYGTPQEIVYAIGVDNIGIPVVYNLSNADTQIDDNGGVSWLK